ncbi:restriction endonuclease [Candidatus Nomurabacteria bacterium]|nr:restriction endonuclease [Candidatus Nomurabacteria bacterium]
MDKRPENKQLRVSPHAMVQEYLNYSEHLYGLVTNGKQLRLLRDASRITRLSYVEFNLQKMLEEDLYSDFVLLHVSRMPVKIDGGAESIIEKYHQEGLEAGSTIRSKLGNAVKDTIKALANGFINHPDNTELRLALQEGKLNIDKYYHLQLRIIYRLLFLFVIEERNLVFAESITSETKRFNQIYFKFYSLLRLRKLARKLPPPDSNRHYDLWQSLLSTFSLFESTSIGDKMGIMALHGDIFSYDAITTDVYDLHQCRLSNSVILKLLKDLGYFENEQGVLISVNYGGLDVEEFGSVYEGLLELKLKIEAIPGTDNWSVDFDRSAERGKSGSHYTPEELVQPLIKHSLEYLIEDRIKPYQQKKATKESTIQSLLSLKICDVACGSGHILLSAARRLALEIARVQTDEEQPNPMAVRKAIKQVVRQCIYGVDKNPLAVELCKVALWLEAHNPGEPLSFLDHHIKCGDAIVGLAHREELDNGIADEAFKTLPGDNKDIAKAFRDQNIRDRKERATKSTQFKAEFETTTESSVQESMVEYKSFNLLPETTPEEIEGKAKAYVKFLGGKGYIFLKAMADTQVAPFFIPKIDENKDKLMTDADFRQILSGHKGWQDRKVAKATAVASELRFFHWFLEFPEVFNEGGFDCILGNPPFLGGQKISGNYGDSFLEFIKYQFSPIGAVDLVTYFFRRVFDIIKMGGYQSLISTNTVSQGTAREGGLLFILKNGGHINFAIKNIHWPGLAAVEVSLIAITKGHHKRIIILNQKSVEYISSYLDDSGGEFAPNVLNKNTLLCYQGSGPVGDGFLLSAEKGISLLNNNPENYKVVKKYLTGDDINSVPNQEPSRYAIFFQDWTQEESSKFQECFNIIVKDVKPEREKNNDKRRREIWWQFSRPTMELYNNIGYRPNVLSINRHTKYISFSLIPGNYIYSDATIIVTDDDLTYFVSLNSIFHDVWTWKNASTMGAQTIRYNPETCFETFPFPQNLNLKIEQDFKSLGGIYHEHRRQLMLSMQLGLTKTYNSFHAKEIQAVIAADALMGLNNNAIVKQLGKEVWNLWNHLQKTPGTCSIEEAIAGIVKLRQLHVEMDNAVLEAYGWSDILLRHDFYEVDYLPENDRVRYTIHPDARKEILKRLLELNYKIHAEEVAAGLWDKKTTKDKSYKIKDPETMMAKEKEKGLGDLFG